MGADLQFRPTRHEVRGPEFHRPELTDRYFFLIFLGSQTSSFFFATAPQSLQRKRPFFGLLEDSPFLQLMRFEIISQSVRAPTPPVWDGRRTKP